MIFYCDTETYQINDFKRQRELRLLNQKPKNRDFFKIESKPYLFGLLYFDTKANNQQNFLHFTEAEPLLNYLWELAPWVEDEKTHTLVFFNVTFDLDKLISWFNHVKRYSFNFSQLIYNEKKEFIKGHILVYGEDKTLTLVFKDLWIFNRNMSVAKYYNLFYPNQEQTKGTIDYDKNNVRIDGDIIYYQNSDETRKTANLKYELDYLKKDVQILPLIERWINDFKDQSLRLLNITPSKDWESQKDYLLTIPSIAKKTIDLFLKTKLAVKKGFDIFRVEISDEHQNDMLKSYNGGFTFKNKYFNNVNSKVWKIDVNSLYPFIEYSHLLPVNKLLINKPDKGTYIKWIKARYSNFVYKPEYDFLADTLPVNTRDVNTRDYFFISEYFEYIQKWGDFEDLEIIEVYYQQTTAAMKEWVSCLYELKSKAKTETERTVAKLLLNSSYGKKGEKPHLVVNTWQYNHTIEEFILTESLEEVVFLSMYTGIFITQSARLVLYKAIDEILRCGGIVYYGDTDSLFCNIDPRETKLVIHDSDIGAWSIESVIKVNCANHNKHNKKCLDCKIEPKPYDGLLMFDKIKKKYFAYRNPPYSNQYSLSFSGVPLKFLEVLDLEDLKTIFNNNNNVLFVNVKTQSITNWKSQTIIRTVDVATKNNLEVTHYLENNVLYTADKYHELKNEKKA